MYRISFYIPADASESVKAAMFDSGAGRIGGYDMCSWETAGVGQFRPLEGSNPFIGAPGRLERVPELKVEMVCDDDHINQVITALRESHPYENPAYAVWKIETAENPGR